MNKIVCGINLFGYSHFFICRGENSEAAMKHLTSIEEVSNTISNLIDQNQIYNIHLFGNEEYIGEIVANIKQFTVYHNQDLIIEVN